MTGSALAMPLLAAGSASAADAATWDRVAECETGGLWSAHFGNGLYGGLQFTQETWETYGGLGYATSADLASRAQQIAVAEKALAAGSTQWATCAPIAGLTNDGAAPGVDPGPAVTPEEPTGPVEESNRTAGLPATPGATTPETGTPETAAPSTSNPTATPETSVTPSAPATPGTGKHRGDAAPEETVNPGESGENGRHAAPTDTPTDAPTGDATSGKNGDKSDSTDVAGVGDVKDVKDPSGVTDTQDNSGEYTVKAGDNLTDIARENELPGGWGALYDANRSTVGADPDLIIPGQSLDLTIDLLPAKG
ncbi:transglycosylase family protein [Streptomyces sp. NBC_01353]|uniref:transglycosylase family protein n=1 Tax=Streptomyces sp. NBC_01353 TaxID=2903835 RepID=UPI002E33FD9B|nr:transglycosylase family protein [Streptomyces sp. NBC_01353]